MPLHTAVPKAPNKKGLDITSILMIIFIVILPFGFYFLSKRHSNHNKSRYGLIQSMLMGNKRFAKGSPVHPHVNVNYLQSIAHEQRPKAVVITCSDSRVSPELIFDEGMGDLFVIRTAGNIIGEVELGSVEYAVEHLKVPLVIVMGHERCGAVQAMLSGKLPHNHIKTIIDSLRNETEIKAIPQNDEQRLAHCVEANVKHGVKELLSQSEVVQEAVHLGKLQVLGAHYDLDDQKVQIVVQH